MCLVSYFLSGTNPLYCVGFVKVGSLSTVLTSEDSTFSPQPDSDNYGCHWMSEFSTLERSEPWDIWRILLQTVSDFRVWMSLRACLFLWERSILAGGWGRWLDSEETAADINPLLSSDRSMHFLALFMSWFSEKKHRLVYYFPLWKCFWKLKYILPIFWLRSTVTTQNWEKGDINCWGWIELPTHLKLLNLPISSLLRKIH